MKIGILGSGGREHAIAWALGENVQETDIYTLPGNGGTQNNVPVETNDFRDIERACRKHRIGFLIVGPEAPLAKGIVDHFAGSDIRVFGPGKQAARLESSKIWAKQFMHRHGVATAPFEVFDRPQDAEGLIHELEGNLVVKYDGLAGGKGVWVCHSVEEATWALREIEGRYGQPVRFLIEQRLSGSELSILGITDGETIRLLLPSQDHKPLCDGDRGPNTGGMGAFCPVPACDQAMLAKIDQAVIQPTLQGLKSEGIAYQGFLYFGLMITAEGPRLLEYNVRLGDPEAEVLLPALKTDLLELVTGCLNGSLHEQGVDFHPGYFVDVVLASGGYPGPYTVGHVITGLEQSSEEVLIFHAGTRRDSGRLVTAGGRVLHIVAHANTLSAAITRAYEQCGRVQFAGMTYRKDIGMRPWLI